MVIDFSSGYNSARSNWPEFLARWSQEIGQTGMKNSFINGFSESFSPVSDAEIEKKAKELKLNKFPRSYLDFIKVHNVSSSFTGKSLMLPFERIDFLKNFDRGLYDIQTSEDWESPDAEYFFYGEGQDNSASRTSFVDHLIVIGRNDLGDFILLNSAVLTKDDEFECFLGCDGFSGIFRSLSFANMMKSLYIYETGIDSDGSYPPYSVTQLNKRAAALVVTAGL